MKKQVARHSIAFAAICTLLAAATSAHAQDSPRSKVEWTKDALEVVKANVEKEKAVLVDVRSEQEWNNGHIEGAIFLPVTSLRAKGGDPVELEKKLPQKKSSTPTAPSACAPKQPHSHSNSTATKSARLKPVTTTS
jgi:3-mercaptopyruvate sulfurtransferase SseA